MRLFKNSHKKSGATAPLYLNNEICTNYADAA